MKEEIKNIDYKKILIGLEKDINERYDNDLVDIGHEDSKALGVQVEYHFRSQLIKNGYYGHHDPTYNSPNPDFIFIEKDYIPIELKGHKLNKNDSYCISRNEKSEDNLYFKENKFNLGCINYVIELKDEYKNLSKEEQEYLSSRKNIHYLRIIDTYIVTNTSYSELPGQLSKSKIHKNYKYEYIVL